MASRLPTGTRIAFLTLLALASGIGPAGCRAEGDLTAAEPTATRLGGIEPTARVGETPTLGTPLRGTIVIWHSWEAREVASLEAVASSFRSRNPEVILELSHVAPEGLRGAYEAAFDAGGGPTVLIGPAAWGPFLFDGERVVDLGPLVASGLLETVIPATRDAVTYREATVGLPHRTEGVVLYRNRALVPAAAETWEQFVAQARAASQEDVMGAVLEQGFFFSGGHLLGMGGSLMRPTGDPAFNTEIGLGWIRLVNSFRDIGPTEYYTDNDAILFRLGLVGYVIDRSTSADAFAEGIGRDNLAVDPWPVYGTGRLAGFVETDCLYLSPRAEGDDRTASLAFMEFMLSREAQALLADRELAGHLPAVVGIDVPDRIQRELLAAFEQGFALPLLPEMAFYWGPMDDALAAVLHSGVDPAEALTAAQERILESLARTRGGG